MLPAELRHTAPRNQVLAIVASDVIGHALRKLLAAHYDVTIVSCRSDALVRVARRQPFDLVLCNSTVLQALELHAAIAHRDPALAGRMIVFRADELRAVASAVLALDR